MKYKIKRRMRRGYIPSRYVPWRVVDVADSLEEARAKMRLKYTGRGDQYQYAIFEGTKRVN